MRAKTKELLAVGAGGVVFALAGVLVITVFSTSDRSPFNAMALNNPAMTRAEALKLTGQVNDLKRQLDAQALAIRKLDTDLASDEAVSKAKDLLTRIADQADQANKNAKIAIDAHRTYVAEEEGRLSWISIWISVLSALLGLLYLFQVFAWRRERPTKDTGDEANSDDTDGATPKPVDPAVKNLRDRVEALETTRDEATDNARRAARTKVEESRGLKLPDPLSDDFLTLRDKQARSTTPPRTPLSQPAYTLPDDRPDAAHPTDVFRGAARGMGGVSFPGQLAQVAQRFNEVAGNNIATGEDFKRGVGAVGALHDVAANGEAVTAIDNGYQGLPHYLLAAVTLDATHFAIVPSFEYSKNFSVKYAQELEARAEIRAIFDIEFGSGGNVICEQPALIRHVGGAYELVQRGRLSGYLQRS
jgi:hypothetical protein